MCKDPMTTSRYQYMFVPVIIITMCKCSLYDHYNSCRRSDERARGNSYVNCYWWRKILENLTCRVVHTFPLICIMLRSRSPSSDDDVFLHLIRVKLAHHHYLPRYKKNTNYYRIHACDLIVTKLSYTIILLSTASQWLCDGHLDLWFPFCQYTRWEYCRIVRWNKFS